MEVSTRLVRCVPFPVLTDTLRRYRYPARNRRPLRLGTYAELESLTAGGQSGEAQLCDIESEEADSGL